MTRDDIVDHVHTYIVEDGSEGTLIGIVNIVIEMCARICLEADFDDMGLCAAELRKLIS